MERKIEPKVKTNFQRHFETPEEAAKFWVRGIRCGLGQF